MAEVRQLKIKTGSVKRLRKELVYYTDQVKLEQEKLDQLRAQGLEPHDLQQAVSALIQRKIGLSPRMKGSVSRLRYTWMLEKGYLDTPNMLKSQILA